MEGHALHKAYSVRRKRKKRRYSADELSDLVHSTSRKENIAPYDLRLQVFLKLVRKSLHQELRKTELRELRKTELRQLRQINRNKVRLALANQNQAGHVQQEKNSDDSNINLDTVCGVEESQQLPEEPEENILEMIFSTFSPEEYEEL